MGGCGILLCNYEYGGRMVRSETLKFKKGDLIAVAIVVVLAVTVLCCFLPHGGKTASRAEIYRDGVLIETVELTEERTFVVEGRYRNVIRVADGAIAFAESDCPGHDCVHSGAINSSGRVLVCLPNGVEIRVVSGESDVDLVVR